MTFVTSKTALGHFALPAVRTMRYNVRLSGWRLEQVEELGAGGIFQLIVACPPGDEFHNLCRQCAIWRY
jgi:hypothetical protein